MEKTFKKILMVVLFLSCMLCMGKEVAATTPSGAKSFDGNAYKRYDESLLWSEAKTRCESMGGHLVTITSEEEQVFVAGLVANGSKHQYWLGANDLSGSFQWVTGESFTFSKWADGQPDCFLKREHYLQMFKDPNPRRSSSPYEWNDASEDNYLLSSEEDFFSLQYIGYICEWENVKNISDAEVSLSKTVYTYDGEARTPSVTVKLDGKTLKEGTDYSVTYTGSEGIGEAYVYIAGKGNYLGKVKKTYTISLATPSLDSISTKEDTTVIAKSKAVKGADGYQFIFTPVKNGNKKTVSSNTRKVEVTGLKSGAKYNVKVRAHVSRNGKMIYSSYSKEKTITVLHNNDLSKAAVTLTPDNYTYDGKEKKPSTTVQINGTTLKKGTDYTVSYKNNKKIGKATVTVKGKGRYKGSQKVTFTIKTNCEKELETVEKDYANRQKAFNKKGRSVIDMIMDTFKQVEKERTKSLEEKIDAILALDANLPKAVHQSLLDTLLGKITDTPWVDASAYKNCKTGADLVKTVAKQIVSEEGSFQFKSLNKTYTVTSNTIGGFGASFTSGAIKSSNGTSYPFGFTAVSKSNIENEMNAMKELAQSKIEEAKEAVISDTKTLLEAGDFSTFLKKTTNDKIYSVLKKKNSSLADTIKKVSTMVQKFKNLKKAYIDVMGIDLTSASEKTVQNKVKSYNAKVEDFQKAVDAIYD